MSSIGTVQSLSENSPSAVCGVLSAEIPSAARPEEEEGGEVRDGRDDRGPAHLHRLVPAPLHVARQICGRSGQRAAGRVPGNHAGRLPGEEAAIRPTEDQKDAFNKTTSLTLIFFFPFAAHLHHERSTKTAANCDVRPI